LSLAIQSTGWINPYPTFAIRALAAAQFASPYAGWKTGEENGIAGGTKLYKADT
jgi:hypothetical protein